ncbi:MAG: Ldh family oxidoreductase [Acidobacteria bacterium]|nr:Ldh family oxidoreductase [Acidobacteriota bacterium]
MRISIVELRKLTIAALKNQGYKEDEISIISEILLYAQLRGNNQGVVKLIGQGMPKDPNVKGIEIEKETPLSVRLNGNQNQAMLVVSRALEFVLEKAKKSGFALAGTNNTSTSSGAVGYFAGKIAAAGFIGFVFSRAPERVAAYGSYKPVFGTNPIAVALPAKPDPVVLDMSTASMSFYGVIEARTAGTRLPEGVGYDAGGNPSTDPAAVAAGALRSFDGGFKGSALAMMVEALAGPLTGASFSGQQDSKKNWGHLIFAIDPNLLGDRDAFQSNLKRLIANIKGSTGLPGVEEIPVPGERGDAILKKTMESGEVEIEKKLLEGLRKAAG